MNFHSLFHRIAVFQRRRSAPISITAISNAFRVKDTPRFLAWCKERGVHVRPVYATDPFAGPAYSISTDAFG